MSDYLKLEKKGCVYILRLNRPEKLNAFSYKNLDEIDAMITALNEDRDCRVLIITGTGRAFSAGADVSPDNTLGDLTGTARVLASVGKFKHTNDLIEDARPFTIAAVNGFCLGAGLELALACDLRVASDNAKLGIPEPAIGTFPGGGACYRLPRQIGIGHAKQLLATCERLSAEKALQIGLVEHVTSPEALLDTCIALGERIARNSTTAILAGKRLMNLSYGMDRQHAMDLDTAWMGVYALSHDRAEGRAAFNEKRAPRFE